MMWGGPPPSPPPTTENSITSNVNTGLGSVIHQFCKESSLFMRLCDYQIKFGSGGCVDGVDNRVQIPFQRNRCS